MFLRSPKRKRKKKSDKDPAAQAACDRRGLRRVPHAGRPGSRCCGLVDVVRGKLPEDTAVLRLRKRKSGSESQRLSGPGIVQLIS